MQNGFKTLSANSILFYFIGLFLMLLLSFIFFFSVSVNSYLEL